MSTDVHDVHWSLHARCRGIDPAIFYPEQYESKIVVAEAQAICALCPVRKPCLEAGMREKLGIWGGETPRGRRTIKRHRRQATLGR